MKDTCIIYLALNIGSFAVLKSCENIPKHSWNAQKSEGDPQKSSKELGIFGGFRLSQFVRGLTADHYFGVLGVFLSVSRVFQRIMGCSRGVPGLFRAVPGLFWECSGSVPGFTDTLTVRPIKRTSSPEGCITVPFGCCAGVAVVNKVIS